MKTEAITIIYEQLHPSGDWHLSCRLDDQLIKKRYIHYTKREATADFQRHVQRIHLKQQQQPVS